MGGMSMTAEQAAQARAAANQNAAQKSGNPVNWNGNAQVPGPPGGGGGGGGLTAEQKQAIRDGKGRKGKSGGGDGVLPPGVPQPVGMGGGNLATQPLWPGGPSMSGSAVQPSGPQVPQVPINMTSGVPWAGAGVNPNAQPSVPQPPNVPYFSMSGGINPNYQGNAGIVNQTDPTTGVVYHQNPLAAWMTTQQAKDMGINTYDQAVQAVGGGQGGGPGGPGPQDGGGGGRGGHGGRGGNQGEVIPGETGGMPTDTASQIALLSRQQGGRTFKMDGNIRNILGSLGRAPQFVGLLQSLGFQPIGQINPDGFYNDWIIPQNLQMTGAYQQMLGSLDPVDSMALQMMISQLFGPIGGAGTPQVPGTTPQILGVPDQPGFGGNKGDLIPMMPEPQPWNPSIPGMPTNPIQLPIVGRK